MPEPRLSVPEVPSPTPDVNEVRLRLLAISTTAHHLRTDSSLKEFLLSAACIEVLAEKALTFLPVADPSSEGL